MGVTEGCNCLGIKSASEAPVKRYNLLVPAVFPPKEPEYQKDLPNGVQKKIKKLGEYLEKYPERSEKVSRRLERRLRKELAAANYGYVKVSAYGYVNMLKAGQSASALFAKELLGEDDDPSFVPVIRTLLRHPKPELHVWGLDILSQFTEVQMDSRYQSKLEEYVDDAVAMAHANRSPGNPEALGGVSVKAQIRDASLTALTEFLKLNGRTQAVPEYLERIAECGLENLDFNVPQPSTAGALTPVFDPLVAETPAPPADGAMDALEDKGHTTPNRNSFVMNPKGIENKVRNSISKLRSAITMERRPKGTKDEADQTKDKAAVLLRDIAKYSKDSSTRRRVLICMFRFIDSQQLWSNPDRVELCLSIFRNSCTEDHEYFVLFSSLIRHLSSQRLSTVDRATLIKFAAAEGENQRDSFSSPSLVFALSELPKYLPQPADSSDKVHLKNSILSCIKGLANAKTMDSGSVIEAVSGLLDRLSHTTSMAMASLECMSTALGVVPSLEQQATYSKQLPRPLLQELLAVISTWSELDARNDAHSALEALLSCYALDQSQMQLLFSAAFGQMCQTTSKPPDFMMICATLMAAIEGSASNQKTLLDSTAFALALQNEGLKPTEGGMSHCSSARQLAALVVGDLLVEKIAQLLNCAGLESLRTHADECRNAVEVEPPFSLHVVDGEFSEWEGSAAQSLKTLRGGCHPEGQLAAAATALQQASLPDDAVTSPWERSELPMESSTISSPARSGLDTNHAQLSEGALNELQANFASLAVTQEDVLVKGAVGVSSLVEAAKGQAMEAELKGSRMPQRRDFGELVASAENRVFTVELTAL